MSDKVKHETPKYLKIKCVKIKSRSLIERVVPLISFSKCTKNCSKPLKFKKRDVNVQDVLKKLKIWSFILSDESDHLKYKVKAIGKFLATPILASN